MMEALGMVETRGLVAAIEAADAMVKAATTRKMTTIISIKKLSMRKTERLHLLKLKSTDSTTSFFA